MTVSLTIDIVKNLKQNLSKLLNKQEQLKNTYSHVQFNHYNTEYSVLKEERKRRIAARGLTPKPNFYSDEE